MSKPVRAFISGCAGTSLSVEERAFFAESRPWGLILFARNVKDRGQLSRLTRDFRDAVDRADAPVLIDQEGGRVQRMKPPEWPAYPPAAAFDRAPGLDRPARIGLARTGARLIAHDLHEAGINVDCLPVLDVPVAGAHDIIGDRAYSHEPRSVADFGRAACEGLLEGGVLPVVKHMPGHGRAAADSHMELPVVTASLAELERSDFAPFRALADMPLAMSAHVVYTAIDPERPATISSRVVREIMRGAIGFDGLIMSDDLSMKALAGTFRQKVEALTAAGLDMALHCSGVLEEAREVAVAAPVLDGKAAERAESALERIRSGPGPFDPVEALHGLQSALAIGA